MTTTIDHQWHEINSAAPTYRRRARDQTACGGHRPPSTPPATPRAGSGPKRSAREPPAGSITAQRTSRDGTRSARPVQPKLNTFRTPATSPSVGPARATAASTQRHLQSAGEAIRVTGRVTALEPDLVDPAAAKVVAVREESDVGDKTAGGDVGVKLRHP
jgi:hypothetical protein